MSHPLTIDVSEEVFSNLNKLALQQGKTPEALAELVSTAVQDLESDPLLRSDRGMGLRRARCLGPAR